MQQAIILKGFHMYILQSFTIKLNFLSKFMANQGFTFLASDNTLWNQIIKLIVENVQRHT